MRICYVGDAGSIHMQRWAAFFADRGHEVHIVTDTEGRAEGCRVHRVGDFLPSVSVRLLSAMYQIRAKAQAMQRIVRRIRPDLLHGHYATNYGFLAALTRHRPLIQTVHGSDILVDPDRSSEERFFVTYALRRADLITAPAHHMVVRLRELGVVRRTVMLQYGVDTDAFCPPADESLRSPFRVVSTRHLDWKYNVELLIRAVPLVRSEIPRARFVLVGDGPDREPLRRLADELSVGDALCWAGKVSYDRMPEVLRSSTVYVSTSLTDGSSLSVLEAMGCGVFPVVTDIPANREWIADGENGFLVPTDRPERLAARIVAALRDERLRENARERNLCLVRERGSYTSNLALVEGLYRDVSL